MRVCGCFFFFNDTATTEIYTLSLHDALPISLYEPMGRPRREYEQLLQLAGSRLCFDMVQQARSEEHTSELQSQSNLVCRLLLEKKKNYARVFINIQGRQPQGEIPQPEDESFR